VLPVTYPPDSTPGAAGDAWTTPAREPSPVTTPIVPTHGNPERPDPVLSGGVDQDAEGTDTVSASVAGAMAAAEARFLSHQQDTYAQGSQIGAEVSLPPVVSDFSKHTGGSDATAYDPAG
jgi:hypothetical protein